MSSLNKQTFNLLLYFVEICDLSARGISYVFLLTILILGEHKSNQAQIDSFIEMRRYDTADAWS